MKDEPGGGVRPPGVLAWSSRVRLKGVRLKGVGVKGVRLKGVGVKGVRLKGVGVKHLVTRRQWESSCPRSLRTSTSLKRLERLR